MTNTTKLLLGTAIALLLSGSAVMAADLYVPPAAAPAAAPASSWDGPYIGASVGYGWGTATDNDYDTSGVTTASTSGWLVGAQAGYNFHLSDNIVAGIEGNLDWLNETGPYNGVNVTPPGGSETINFEGSVRGRVGIDAGNFLPYIEAGVAFANANIQFEPSGATADGTYTGWTVGAGVEFMLADHLSANLEYRYSDYGTQTFFGNSSVNLTDNTVRVGLNYHF